MNLLVWVVLWIRFLKFHICILAHMPIASLLTSWVARAFARLVLSELFVPNIYALTLFLYTQQLYNLIHYLLHDIWIYCSLNSQGTLMVYLGVFNCLYLPIRKRTTDANPYIDSHAIIIFTPLHQYVYLRSSSQNNYI
jgi:hypothetical protein